jgi:hypothetical protein
MNSTSGYINMKKKLALLLLVPLIATTSCAKDDGLSAVKQRVDQIEKTDLHPYYRVIGSIDYNNTFLQIDENFDQMPQANKFVPHARYNEGFYNVAAQTIYDETMLDESDIVINMMASRSYWLRAPLKVDKTNFEVKTESGARNSTCAVSNLIKLIATWYGTVNNPSSKNPYFVLLDDGGFAIGGVEMHTKFKIDNFPIYPDHNAHPTEIMEWDEDDPLPMYLTEAEGKVNIRFEYDKDGWLKREYCATVGYDYSKATAGQFAFESRYIYKNGDVTW